MSLEEKKILWEKVMGIRTRDGEIEDLFEEGKPCDVLYERLFEAKERILLKLGLDECRDMEEILCCEDEICMYVALRMFDYGVEYASRLCNPPLTKPSLLVYSKEVELPKKGGESL